MNDTDSGRSSAQGLHQADVSKLIGRYMSFMLDDEEYGIGILKVREIIGMQDSTPIPCMPPFVKGVINLRGRIIPLIDLRIKLGLGEGERTHETCTIVTEVRGGAEGEVLNVACIVDAVSEVIEFAADNLEPPPRLGMAVDVSFLLGLGKIEGREKVVTLIDIDTVLAELIMNPVGEAIEEMA